MKSVKALLVGTVALGAIMLSGCFMTDSGKSGGNATLELRVGVKDVNSLAKASLAKSAVGTAQGIVLSKLVVTLTSSVETDAVIRDTIVADDSAGSEFVPGSEDAQQVYRDYSIKALRNWTVEVKTLDVNDSVIHKSTASANNITIGEERPVTLNLTSRFVVYVAKFTLPDSIGSSDTNVTMQQKLNINRFVMVVDGDTVRDTTSTGYYAPDPDFHLVEWPYVRSDTVHTVELYVYTDSLGSWDPTRPLFGDTLQITSIDTTYTPTLPWTGPGSPNDPDYDPANPGGAKAGLTIDIGAVGRVDIEPSLPSNPLPKRKN